ncbi:MAG: FAD:protein FMN transferase [Enterobacterales bacterium]|nr:FAD:protein FMN transferase [Enterobacterales bacterium]
MKLQIGLFFLIFLSSNISAKWYSQSFDVMGTRAKVEFESDSEQLAKSLINQTIQEMQRIDQAMSPFKTTSEISRINRMAAKAPLIISKEMIHLIEKSLYYSRLTKGSFDITFSSLGYLFDYRNHTKPTKQQKQTLVKYIDYRSVILKPVDSTIYFKHPQIKIDFGGIAKGYAVDQCIDILKANGIKNAFVNAGGDSRVIGRKNGRLWYVGVRHPRDANKLIVNIPLENLSISTSGDYERYFTEKGVRYRHIIDPTTGDSARLSQSVTILADYSIDADALSTSIFILGTEKGLALINRIPGVSAIIVDKEGKLSYSDDLTDATH